MFVSSLIIRLFLTIIMLVIALHFIVMATSIWTTLNGGAGSLLNYVYLMFVIAANVCGALLIVTFGKSFDFFITDQENNAAKS